MTSSLLSRIGRQSLRSKVMPAEEALKFFQNGQKLGWSGFTPVGYPKAVPIALANHVEANKLQGKMKFDLFIGASVGVETEDRWAELDMINRRWPYQSGKHIAEKINSGKLAMGDIHLSTFAVDLAYGFFTGDENGALDIALIEATAINEDGSLVLSGSVGASPEIVSIAKSVIVEINTSVPSIRGIHDIVGDPRPPHRRPYLISRVDDKIGGQYLKVDPEKIVAIVESRYPDNGRDLTDPDKDSQTIAGHLIEFFQHEVSRGRLPSNLLPLQSGVGNIANAVVAGLATSPFEQVDVWTEVLQDTMLDYFDTEKLRFASSTSLSLSRKGFERFYSNLGKYKNKVVLRPQQITNHPEIIRRLGVIAMNTPIEVDIYGHANSTLVGGSKMVHGIGGSGDFLRNAYISIMHTPSVRKTKTDPTGITCIVPMCSHIDHTEHDICVIVTEQGLADLRGLEPRTRALKIIEKCVHPDYKPILKDYYEFALKRCLQRKSAHEPQVLDSVFKMYKNLEEKGTMKINGWV